jgi:glycogen debranching enzyme
LAYHQGCTRPELLGAYIDINFKMVGPAFVKKVEYLLEGFLEDISKHGVGAFSELYDGDPPHEPHGAISSACATASLLWSEYLIAVNKLEK